MHCTVLYFNRKLTLKQEKRTTMTENKNDNDKLPVAAASASASASAPAPAPAASAAAAPPSTDTSGATTSTAAAAATKTKTAAATTSKDITNLIQITNEYDVVGYNNNNNGSIVQEDDILASSDSSGTSGTSGTNNNGDNNCDNNCGTRYKHKNKHKYKRHAVNDPFKCLFGAVGPPSFCPIGNKSNNEMYIKDYVNVNDDHDNDNNDNDNNDNDGIDNNDDSSGSDDSTTTTTSDDFDIRKVFDHSAIKSVRGALDEHIVSKVDVANKSIQDVLDNKVVPHIHSARRQSIETITNIQKKSINTFDDVKQKSIRTIDNVKDDTNKFVQNVKQSSSNTLNVIQSQTKNIIENIIDNDVTNNIKPKITYMIDSTHTTVVTKTKQCQACIKSIIHNIIITYRPYYWGMAPGLNYYNMNNNNNNNNNSNCDYDHESCVEPHIPILSWYWLVLQEGSLRSFSKVLFCDNPITGILIWLGILYSSPLAGLCSMIGVLTVNSTALYFNMDNEKVRNGQYGRNSVLIGPSIVDCFNFEFAFGTTSASAPTSSRTWPILFFFSIVLSLVTLSVESIWIRESFQRRFRLWNTNTTTNTTTTLPSLLLPYNITLLIALLFAKVWNYTMSTQIEFQNHYHVSDDDDGGIDTNNNNNTRFIVYRAVLNGLSRIFFVDGIVTGILILIGVGLCSRIIAISLICGSFVSSFVLGFLVFEESYDYLNYGYAGFNPALCAAGIFFYFVPSYKLIGLSLIAAIISTVIVSGSIDVLLRIMGIPVSTSIGFCLTLLPLLSMDLESIFGQGHFIRRIPESQLSTPEGYLDSIRSPAPPSLEEGSNDDDDDGDEAVVDVADKTTPIPEEVYDNDDDIDEESGFIVTKTTSDSDDALPTNEETPLLSGK